MAEFRLLRVLRGLHRVGNTVFHRTLADSVEAVFILVAFRRFAQFSDNQREGEQPTTATKKPAATIMTKIGP